MNGDKAIWVAVEGELGAWLRAQAMAEKRTMAAIVADALQVYKDWDAVHAVQEESQ